MTIDSVSSRYPIIDQSFRMAEEAALELNLAQRQQEARHHQELIERDNATSMDFNKIDFHPKSSDLPAETDLSASVKLTQANQYGRVGTNMLQRDQEMIGSLLDIHI
ncbi:hypothetical protein [Vibrio sp.]|uniref:hypothetical protein n=1 Tax=Vibrio sp. TaxID=678 RepID=UPI003D0D0561